MSGSSRCILAGALFVSWSIFLTGWYGVSAMFIAGKNFSDGGYGELGFAQKQLWPLGLLAWLSFAGAVVLLVIPALRTEWRETKRIEAQSPESQS